MTSGNASRGAKKPEGQRRSTAPELVFSVRNLHLSSPTGVKLIDGASFSITADTRAALVGPNGSGKSSLLRALTHFDGAEPDGGEVTFGRQGRSVEYVPQHPPEYLLSQTALEALIERLRAQHVDDVEEWKAHSTLADVGFTDAQMSTRLKDLSGGEVNRVMLARALLTQPPAVLLDEPTNHLDTQGVLEFEQTLQSLKIPFLLVSHDRELLDRLTNQTFFLWQGKIHFYGLPYTRARQEFEGYKASLFHLKREQEKKLEKIEDEVRRIQPWARKSDDMAAVLRRTRTKLERHRETMIELPREQRRDITLDAAQLEANSVLRVLNWTVSVPENGRSLFSVEHLVLAPKDRCVIMGVNGAGKTTFIEQLIAHDRFGESLAGQRAPARDSGISFNPQVRLGYYDQNQRGLDPKASLLEYVIGRAHLGPERAHASLVAAGFPYERHRALIGTLSGGERARLQLLAMNTAGVNFLVLDEPTNHVDLEGVEQIEENLCRFEGTVLFVSHDRRFVKNIANRFFLIRDGFMREVSGVTEYVDYLAHIQERRERGDAPQPSSKSGHAAFRDSLKRSGKRQNTQNSLDQKYGEWLLLAERQKALAEGSAERRALDDEIRKIIEAIDRIEQSMS